MAASPVLVTPSAAVADAGVMLDRLAPRLQDASERHPHLQHRVHRHFDDFWDAYVTLYGHQDDLGGRVERLFEILVDAADERPQWLQARDEEREQNPAWFQEPRMIGMMMYADLFADTIEGVEERRDYLRDLGVTYLHLMPILRPRSGPNDGGYAVASYREVAEHLGSMEDLRSLAQSLDEDDTALVLDFVMNHTAREHVWAERALAGDPAYQDYYYFFDTQEEAEAWEATLPEVFPDFAPGNFSYVPALRKWVWTTFYAFQWDLNYRNPEVFAAMLGEMLFLANAGASVLRLDAVPFVWKRMGTNCQNQPEVLLIIKAYRALMRMVAPGTVFKIEAIVAPDDLVQYLGVGPYEGLAGDVAYHATLMCHLWHALASENTHLIRTALRRLPETPRTAAWINYVRCHDDIGWGLSDVDTAAVHQDGFKTRLFCSEFYAGQGPGSYAEGYRFQINALTREARTSGTAAALTGLQRAMIERDQAGIDLAVERLLMLHSIIYFMKGLPLLYSGDEIGQFNSYAYLSDPDRAGDNRWTHRPAMDWLKAERRHIPGTPEHRLFIGVQHLGRVRTAQPALHARSADTVVLPDSDSLLVVERVYEPHALLLLANFSRNPARVSLDRLPARWRNGAYINVLSGRPVTAEGDGLNIPGYWTYWLRAA